MSRIVTIMLAGSLRPTPLAEALGRPPLCLPIAPGLLLLDDWRRVLAEVDGGSDLRIVLSSESDVSAVAACAGRGTEGEALHIMAEPAAWRGTGGLLRDVSADLDADDLVIVAEAACLPPISLAPLLAARRDGDVGVVGVCDDDRPAGVYVFTRAALEEVPRVGYRDLKEQLLPALHRSGSPVRTARLGERFHRIRDRRSYLAAVRSRMDGAVPPGPDAQWQDQASISGSAILEGFCLVQSGAVIEDGAVVHESVVLSGATIGGGAVISRSVIGAKAVIEPRRQVIRQIVGAAEPAAPGRELLAVRER